MSEKKRITFVNEKFANSFYACLREESILRAVNENVKMTTRVEKKSDNLLRSMHDEHSSHGYN
jgi:hypothetical protein